MILDGFRSSGEISREDVFLSLLWRIVENCFHARSFSAGWDRVNLRCTKLDFANTLISRNTRILMKELLSKSSCKKTRGWAPTSIRWPTALSVYGDTIKVSEGRLVVDRATRAAAGRAATATRYNTRAETQEATAPSTRASTHKQQTQKQPTQTSTWSDDQGLLPSEPTGLIHAVVSKLAVTFRSQNAPQPAGHSRAGCWSRSVCNPSKAQKVCMSVL